jgi:cyclopropane fatty-acyl-phospholipid synthase-like methyltransferase
MWEHEPDIYYDRVMPAWRLIMGCNLHYGYFEFPGQSLDIATQNLTLRVASYAKLSSGLDVLDVGCGDGQGSCFLAKHFDCRVVGISTGKKGVEEACLLSEERGLSQKVQFMVRDGMDNGFSAGSFDRVWVMQSSHFMLDKRRLLEECARVLRPGGRVAIADIILRVPLTKLEVVRHREEFSLLHKVFGRAKMETLKVYQSAAEEVGLGVDLLEDISDKTFPTFECWRHNAVVSKDALIHLVGETLWRDYLEASSVLERFWAKGWLGYGILAAVRPQS